MSIAPYENRGEIMESPSTIEAHTPNASYAVIKATIDSQIATARAFRRDLKRSVNDVKTYAGLTLDVAKSCVYALPRGGKTIEGPSARFAEILASCWGNLRVQGRVIEETATYIVVVGECIDLERNSGRSVEIRRNIVDKYGKKYNPDMVAMTANAAISIATRNAIFQVVPRALWEEAYQDTRAVIKGSLKSIDEERKIWIEFWGGYGVTEDRVYEALNITGRESLTLDHVVQMQGWNNAINTGESTINELFPLKAVVSVKAQNLTATLADVKNKTAMAADAKAKVATDAAAATQAKQPAKTDAKPQDFDFNPG